MVFLLVFSKYMLLASRKNLCLFPFRIPTLELNVLACLRREMGGKRLHPSPSISFASFISVNKSVGLLFFSLESRNLLDKYCCYISNIITSRASDTEKEIFTYNLTTLTHQLCFYFSRFFSSWPI